MTPLESLIRTHIQTHGPMDVADYMANCLYHPQHGYYTNGRNFLPAPQSGTPYPHDFTTAPELTPLFGAIIARWVALQFVHLRKPPTFTLMECGPGRGTLMRDMLTCLQIDHPEAYAAAQPLLIETSPSLTQLQQQTLKAFPQCRWNLTPESPLPTILIANELLDAFPHTQHIIQTEAAFSRQIGINETGHLAFTPTGNATVSESSPAMHQWLQSLPHTLDAALFADYGAYTEGSTGDTLQALHKHTKVDVFHRPGESDLTTHVNFYNVEQALRTSHPHLEAQPMEDLAPFLLRHGLASLALDLQQAAGAPHPATESALQRLLHPAQMGTLFKVSCFIRTRP